jgi:virginiamycin B lyase
MGVLARRRGVRVAYRCGRLALVLVTVLAGTARATPTKITEFPVEVGHPTNIDHLAADPNGTVWFADGYWPEGSFHALIGRLEPIDGEVQEFDKGLGKFSVIRDFVAGPDGNMWFADSGSAGADAAIGKITKTGQITEYASPVGGKPWWLIDGPSESLWFAAKNAVGSVTTSGSLGAYELPRVLGELAVGPDGNVWFTYGSGEYAAIGRVEVHDDGSALITLFHDGLGPHSVPERLVAAGGYLWFTDLSGAEPAIGRVSPDGKISEFREGLSAESMIIDIAAGSDGNVWFTDSGAGAVGKITPGGQISEFTNEAIQPFVYYRNEVEFPLQHLVAGPDGNMWFTIRSGSAVLGKITPTGHITTFRAGEDGIGEGVSAGEITVGPGGELWFVASGNSFEQAIGRIVPGDDDPPFQPPNPEKDGMSPRPDRVVVTGGKPLRADRSGMVRVRLLCESTTTPCGGTLQLNLFLPRASGRRVVGSASLSLLPGGSRTLSIRIDRQGRNLLARRRHRRAELTFTQQSGVGMVPFKTAISAPPRSSS